MVKGKSRQHEDHLSVNDQLSISTLKFSAIYGANGAGKSNWVKALRFAKNLIVKNEFESQHRDYYCRSKPENKEKSTDFEFEILINNDIYSYGFSINLYRKVFLREWLYKISNSTEVEIFTYDKTNNELKIPNLSKNKNNKMSLRFQIYNEDYLNQDDFNKSLFINFINSYKLKFSKKDENEFNFNILNDVYIWFKKNIDIIQPNSQPKQALTYLTDTDTSAFENFLSDFGTGIQTVTKTNISIEDVYAKEDKNFIDYVNYDISEKVKSTEDNFTGMLKTKNNLYLVETLITNNQDYNSSWYKFTFSSNNKTDYCLGELSDGTIRLLELFSILNNNKKITFIVDEIDRSLHPNLTYNFIKYFLKNDKNAQLIVTTHEDRILDLDILRRDEIWFIDKDNNGCSQLYSLEKFKIRFDQDVMKAYLDGRYGSIPKFKFFD
ncbi:AAA family ATPase [Acinetobacter modestus]|uniref:AAA family ATPase n=1 Tax=Acinetobacter modestus TaxID=1776740 RepID=UPI00320A295D